MESGGRSKQAPHNHPSAERRLQQSAHALCRSDAHLTTILQPKGGCDAAGEGDPNEVESHNHPSAERRLRHHCRLPIKPRLLSQPSFSRKAVATGWVIRHGRKSILTTILQPKGGCDAMRMARICPSFSSQPSFSRKAVATPALCHRPARRRTHNHPSAERRLRPLLDEFVDGVHLLTTILQPKGGCDSTRVRARPSRASHNHPSAERRLRRDVLQEIRAELGLTTILQPKGGCDDRLRDLGRDGQPHNHPSAERRLRPRAFITASSPRSLTTILQPKGGCDSASVEVVQKLLSHNHPSAERRLRPATALDHTAQTPSQPSFSRKAVATLCCSILARTSFSQPSLSRKAVATCGPGRSTRRHPPSQPSFSRKT